MSHTPEPWEIYDGQIVRMFNGTPQLVATCHYGNQSDRAADLDRIVACVNACAGLDVAEVAALLDAIRAEAKAKPQTTPWFKAVDAVHCAARGLASDLRGDA